MPKVSSSAPQETRNQFNMSPHNYGMDGWIFDTDRGTVFLDDTICITSLKSQREQSEKPMYEHKHRSL
jgi:hypothetical protein